MPRNARFSPRDPLVSVYEVVQVAEATHETIARGGFAGHTLGLAISFLDLPTFIRVVGAGSKAGVAARAAAYAWTLALPAPRRKLNVGLSVPIGSGFGVLAHTLLCGHPLHPDNNPATALRFEFPIEGPRIDHGRGSGPT